MKEIINQLHRPSKEEQRIALESYGALATALEQLNSENPEIEIEETTEKIKVPLKVLKLFANLLREVSEGRAVSIVAGTTEMTTQAAAELMGCSRPFLIKLLEEGKIPFTKVGRHRRVRADDVMNYKKLQKTNQKALLVDMIRDDAELGLYDS